MRPCRLLWDSSDGPGDPSHVEIGKLPSPGQLGRAWRRPTWRPVPHRVSFYLETGTALVHAVSRKTPMRRNLS